MLPLALHLLVLFQAPKVPTSTVLLHSMRNTYQSHKTALLKFTNTSYTSGGAYLYYLYFTPNKFKINRTCTKATTNQSPADNVGDRFTQVWDSGMDTGFENKGGSWVKIWNREEDAAASTIVDSYSIRGFADPVHLFSADVGGEFNNVKLSTRQADYKGKSYYVLHITGSLNTDIYVSQKSYLIWREVTNLPDGKPYSDIVYSQVDVDLSFASEFLAPPQ